MAYATTDQLYAIGVPAAALADVSVAYVSIGLQAASSFVDSYLRARYPVPLSTYAYDITRATCIIAAYDLMVARGYSPDSVDQELRNRYLDILKWLEDIRDGHTSPVDTSPSDVSSASYGVTVDSGETARGW